MSWTPQMIPSKECHSDHHIFHCKILNSSPSTGKKVLQRKSSRFAVLQSAEVKANFSKDKATILNHWSKYHFWKNGSAVLHTKLDKFFTYCWEQGKFPQKLHYNIITLHNNKRCKVWSLPSQECAQHHAVFWTPHPSMFAISSPDIGLY